MTIFKQTHSEVVTVSMSVLINLYRRSVQKHIYKVACEVGRNANRSTDVRADAHQAATGSDQCSLPTGASTGGATETVWVIGYAPQAVLRLGHE